MEKGSDPETSECQKKIYKENKFKDTFLDNGTMKCETINFTDIKGLEFQGKYAISQDHRYFFIQLLEVNDQSKIYQRHIYSDSDLVYESCSGDPKETKLIYDFLANPNSKKETLYMKEKDHVLENIECAEKIFNEFEEGDNMLMIKMQDPESEDYTIHYYLNLYLVEIGTTPLPSTPTIPITLDVIERIYDKCRKCKFFLIF